MSNQDDKTTRYDATKPIAPLIPKPMTEEQRAALLTVVHHRKFDPVYLKELEAGVSEYRRRIQEEYERDLAAEEEK